MKTQGSLKIVCPSFSESGEIPKRHTGFGEDISPQIDIFGISDDVKTLAVIMDDLDVPFVGELNHWLIWNLPPQGTVDENIPHGAECQNGVRQGIAYGKNRYRGPKQPPFMKKAHRYRFSVYGLDCALSISTDSRKNDLISAMAGHILQSGETVGFYKP